MKRIFALMLVFVLIFALCACSSKENEDNTNNINNTITGDPYEINWGTLPDTAIVGAWQSTDSDAGEYILFTPESKLRVVMGTQIIEADITYGVDMLGNKSAYTDGLFLYGQWTYAIDGTNLTITYPVTDSESEEPEFKEISFIPVDYKPITLVAKDSFVADDSLVGTWTNAAYDETYLFTEDGFVVYEQSCDNGINVYDAEIKGTYTVDGSAITMYTYDDNSNEEQSHEFEFSIEGTKLLIESDDGSYDYYLNGEGDPAATEPAE